jgi:hypothetical protein
MTATLVKLSTPGQLFKAAAASYERVMRALKKAGVPTRGTTHADHAHRTLARQIYLLERNYDHTPRAGLTDNNGGIRYWNGRTWYRKPGHSTVAEPGTSNHGRGVAVDFQGLGDYDSATWAIAARILREHGWSNTEGKSIGEWWHWVYNPDNDKHKEDDIMTPAQEEKLDQVLALVRPGLAGKYGDGRLAQLVRQARNSAAEAAAASDGKRTVTLYKSVVAALERAGWKPQDATYVEAAAPYAMGALAIGGKTLDELEATRDELAAARAEIGALHTMIAALTTGGIDYDRLAQAVNDEAARRLTS